MPRSIDLIDRNAAIEAVEVAMNEADAIAALRALPPVTPDPLGAEWIRREHVRKLLVSISPAIILKDAMLALDCIPGQTDPLGAEWMRRQAAQAILPLWEWDNAGHLIKRGSCDQCKSAILDIPGPTPDDLDRAALARPKVAALVKAAQHLKDRSDRGDSGTVASNAAMGQLFTALAALREVE